MHMARWHENDSQPFVKSVLCIRQPSDPLLQLYLIRKYRRVRTTMQARVTVKPMSM